MTGFGEGLDLQMAASLLSPQPRLPHTQSGLSSSSYEDTSPIGSGLHPHDLTYLNHFLGGPNSNTIMWGEGYDG